jgi:pimeloyl-ACP methyl ester carboxylesterase
MRRPARLAPKGIRYVEVDPGRASAGHSYLLLHGLGGSLEQWAEVVPRLGCAARTVSIDIPGFGHSRTLNGHFDLDEAAEQILAFCQRKELTSCTVVSHSITSVVAAKLATADPARFRRLVFVSGTLPRASAIVHNPVAGLAEPKLLASVTMQFLAGVLPVPRFVLVSLTRHPLLRRALLWPFVASPATMPTEHLVEVLTGTGSTAVLGVLATANSIDYDKIIGATTQPVDIIAGARDRLINEADIARVRQLAHVAREATIDNCGHWPWLEDPTKLVEFILESEQA